MSVESWPFPPQDTSLVQYTRLFAELADSGVCGSIGTNVLEVFGDSTGRQVKVRAGSALVRGHTVRVPSVQTLAIAAAHATLSRRDRVVARLNPSTNSVTLHVIQGTAASNPSLPALTQTETGIFDLPLGVVLVGPGVVTINAAAVTDDRWWIGAWTTATRPSSPRVGKTGWNATLGRVEVWTGSEWVAVGFPTGNRKGQVTRTTGINFGGTGAPDVTLTELTLTGAPAGSYLLVWTAILVDGVQPSNGKNGELRGRVNGSVLFDTSMF